MSNIELLFPNSAARCSSLVSVFKQLENICTVDPQRRDRHVAYRAFHDHALRRKMTAAEREQVSNRLRIDLLESLRQIELQRVSDSARK